MKRGMKMLTFRSIDLEKDRNAIIEFRKDSFLASFGELTGFHEEKYLKYVQEGLYQFPEGYVISEKDGEVVGQLELSVRMYDGKPIGYIHLFYLVPEQRGKGHSQDLQKYAVDFFRKHRMDEYHLRVAPGNPRARRFYEKNGMKEIGPELEGKVIRMQGFC